MTDTREAAPWELPNCPECGSNLYVGGCRTDAGHRFDYYCHRDSLRFNVNGATERGNQ